MAKAKYTQRSDGRFYTTYWDGTYTPDGQKRRIAVYSSKSSADLERKVNRLKHDVEARLQNGEDPEAERDMDIYLYAKYWLETYKGKKSLNTRNMYTGVIEKYIYKLSGLNIRQIRHSHIQFLINEAFEHPRSCQQLLMALKQIMRSAARDKYYKKSSLDDLFADLTLPRYASHERRALTPAEKDAVKKAPFTDRERTYVYIAYGCGLRRGEILALTPFDVDFKRQVIKVTKAVEFDINTPFMKDTKNHRDREVPMPPFLSDWLSRQMKGRTFPFLVSKQDGSQMTKSSYDKMWNQIKKKIFFCLDSDPFSSLEDYDLTTHYFRHNYCASLCYQVPLISIKKISQLLGDSEKMVLEVYNHIIEEHEKVDEALQNAINL